MQNPKTNGAKGSIIVAGGLNMDIVTVADRLPDVGEYVYGSGLHFIPGGNGLNQAVAAARLGSQVQIAGYVGEDDFGRAMASFLKDEKVDTRYLKVIRGAHSGTLLYMITGKVERHVVFPGSNMKATVSDMPEMGILASDIVVSQLTIPQEITYSIFKKAKRSGARTILNLFPNNEVSNDLLDLCDYVILNEVELAFRTGSKQFASSQHKDLQMDSATVMKHVKKIRTRSDQTIITTLADRGAIGIRGDELTVVKGIKVNFVDATGAGDCFLGAFATALAEGKGFRESLEFANCAAALSVQKIGATTSFPSRNEVDALGNKNR